ncbi:retrovirus-related pol polyprotein LINE-1 [Tanacetum coccineum]
MQCGCGFTRKAEPCDEETSRRVKTAESFQEKHALLNTNLWQWTLYSRGFNAGGWGAISASDANSMWNVLASIIIWNLGGCVKTHTTHMESWWMCEEVQSKFAKKQARFIELLSCHERNQEERFRAHEREPEGREEVVDPNILPHFDCYYSRISQTEVRTSLQKMDRNKAVGPGQIPIESWRSLGAEGISWLTSLFNKIFTSAKKPKEWRLGESDSDKAAKRNLVSENQFSYMLGQSSIEAIHLIRSLVEKYRERQKDLHLAFIDLEKAYDNVPQLHQGSAISPYLFALILDKLSRRIQEDIQWCLIFADDIVLVSESAEALATRMEVAELRMLRWTYDKTMLDMILNGVFRAELEVETIFNKLRRRGRPKLRWEDRVKLDMKELFLSGDMTSDRNDWREIPIVPDLPTTPKLPAVSPFLCLDDSESDPKSELADELPERHVSLRPFSAMVSK